MEENGRPFTISREVNSRKSGRNYFVEINSRSKFFKQPSFFKRSSIALLIFTIILLIGLIVLLALYLRKSPRICTSNECLRSATNLLYSQDITVKPCDNFYKHVCGKWPEEHLNYGWFQSFSNIESVTEKITLTVMNFFTTLPKDEEPRAVLLSRIFFASCIDIKTQNEVGLSVVYKYLEKLGLPLLPSAITKSEEELAEFSFDWLKTDAMLGRILLATGFIGFSVTPNILNRSENVIYVGSSGFTSPLPSPFKKHKKSGIKSADTEELEPGPNPQDEIRKYIFKYIIQTIAKNNSIDEIEEEILDKTGDTLNEIIKFVEQTKLACAISEVDKLPSYSFEDFQKITDEALSESEKQYPDIWEKYIGYYFEDTNVTLDTSTEKIYTTEIDLIYLSKILNFVLGTPEVSLELYMWWISVYSMIINTTTDIIEFIEKLYGISKPFTRTFECTTLTMEYMAMAVSYAIFDKNFVNNTKPKVETMLNNIKDAFVDRVQDLSWLDKSTKKDILAKSDEMVSLIGFPDWLFNNESLDDYYQDIELHADSYLQNMLTFIESVMPEKILSLRSTNSRTWTMDPTSVNAQNSLADNSINIPIAILSFPFYYHGLEVLNYGSIGAILGHELTHGFDNTGRKYDKFGNQKQWWSNKTIEIFENMTQCFVDQYNNIIIEEINDHVDGLKTLDENIADNGGLNQAYVAYKKYVKKYGEEPKLAGLEKYTHDQLFFISFANVWCGSSSPEALQDNIANDEHSVNSVRVLGTLQNSNEFARAFKCKKGSFMNPDRKKCKIW